MSTDKSTKVRNMLKIPENTGKKGDTNVKKYKPRIICINTFGQNNDKVLSGKCNQFEQFARRKGGEGKR